MSLSGRKIVLGVTGSIAAYKAADLASRLVRAGADVHVILTRAASEFVGAATFRALTMNPVLTGVFDEPYDRQIAHIALAQQSDLILVAPATADILAKMAHGIADDLLSATLLAATEPVLAAPAMNSAMLAHPATQANLRTLVDRGVELIEPGVGQLACRTEGPGRLADVDDIVSAVIGRLERAQNLRGVRVLITAGATREPIDPVRFLSNRSSGRMGFAAAEAAAARGAQVCVVAGHTTATIPPGVEVIRVGTTAEMLEATRSRFSAADVLIAAAAPADYTPVEPVVAKRKKSGVEWTVTFRETPDILAALAEAKRSQVLVGFAAETEELLDHAAKKLAAKRLDMIVANDVTAEGAGFDVETNVVTFLWPGGRCEQLPLLHKRQVAERILDAVLQLLPERAHA